PVADCRFGASCDAWRTMSETPPAMRRSRAGSNVRSPDKAAAQGREVFEQGRQAELGTLGRDLVAAAVLRGDFLLRSGARSSYYIDKYLFTTRPDLLQRLASELAGRVPEGVQRIAGPAIGAIPLITALSLQTGLPMVIVRPEKPKEYGTAKQIEGSLEAGERVFVVEDVVTTARAALATVDALREAGAAW